MLLRLGLFALFLDGILVFAFVLLARGLLAMLVGNLLRLLLIDRADLRVVTHIGVALIFTITAACILILVVIIRLVATGLLTVALLAHSATLAYPLSLRSFVAPSILSNFVIFVDLGCSRFASLLTCYTFALLFLLHFFTVRLTTALFQGFL